MRPKRFLPLGLLAWRGAKRVKRHRLLALLAWRGARWYLGRRRLALRLAFGAVVALSGAIRAVRTRHRRFPGPLSPP